MDENAAEHTGHALLTDISRRLRGVADAVLDLVLPPRCAACGALVGATGTVCTSCWQKLSYIGPPLCDRCGVPFVFAPAGPLVCGACIAMPPVFTRARSALVYNESSKSLVLGFKHQDRTFSASGYARWMARAGADLLVSADFVAPVPLHRWRLFRRGYNQAALLIRALHQQMPTLTPAYRMLVRKRATPPQGVLTRPQRHENVRGAFAVHADWTATLPDRAILLVDDVLTTGATVNECARILLKAGAARVDVLTLARTNLDV